MIEDELISFLQEGPKIGEKAFRDRFGYCPRGLLRVLTGTIILKYKERGLVAYRLMEDVFINDNNLDGLELDTSVPTSDFMELINDPILPPVIEEPEYIDQPIEDDFDPFIWEQELPEKIREKYLQLSNERKDELIGLSHAELQEILFPVEKRNSFLRRIFKR